MIEEIEVVPPCRVLFRAGKPVDEIVTVRQRFNERYTKISIPPAEKMPFIPHTRAAGRPRVANPKKPRVKQPGIGTGAWNKRPDITVDAILKLQAEGLTAKQIGERYGVTHYTIFGRLRANRRSNPEVARADALLRLCACGRRKWPIHPTCTYCRTGRKIA